MKGIQKIQNEIREDIELYYNLHKHKTGDLLEHCIIMTDELVDDAIRRIDQDPLSI